MYARVLEVEIQVYIYIIFFFLGGGFNQPKPPSRPDQSSKRVFRDGSHEFPVEDERRSERVRESVVDAPLREGKAS